MEQPLAMQQFAHIAAQPVAQPQQFSNMQAQPAGLAQALPAQQALPGGAVLQAAGAARPALPGGVPAGLAQLPGGGVSVPVQQVPAPGMQQFQLPIPGAAAVARPPGVPGMPTAAVVQPRPAVLPPQLNPAAAAAMLPLLGYPLPLMQSVQSVSLEELSKHSGFPLPALQAQPQLQVMARQLMLQRIMAFQLQSQALAAQQAQQRPGMMVGPPRAAAPAAKPRAAPKQPKQTKQSKAAAARAAAAAAAAESSAGGDVGGKLIWAKLSNYPWWPAKTLSENDPSFPPDADPPRPTSIPIRFFGTYEFCWIGSKRAMADWDEAYEEHVRGCDQDSFRAAVQEVEHYKRTGELPQAFYIRPAPEGRAKARGGKQRKRPRAAAEPGAAVLDAYGMPVAAAPPAAAPARSRPAARAALAAEERAALAASRKRRLLQAAGLAAPDDSPWANGRIAPNPALLALEAEFEAQWPAAERPKPEPKPEPAPAPAAAAAQPQGQQAAAQPGAAAAEGLAAVADGHVPPATGAAAAPLLGGFTAQLAAAGGLAMPPTAAAAAAAAAPPPQQHAYVGHLLPQQAQQQAQLHHLHQLTPQQVALMAGFAQQGLVQHAAPQS